MSYRGFKILAVIPARGGSKGIPRKNLCQLAGVSLVGHAARVAQHLEWIDRTVLSTDDEEIAAEGRTHGLEVPFRRPAELASDSAVAHDVWKHAWLTSEKHYSDRFDISILLEPTSPLRRPEDIILTVDALLDGDYAAAATVSSAPAHFTPQKCLVIDDKGILGFYHQDGRQFSIRQKIPPYYFRNGICYALKRHTLLEKGMILEENCRAVIIARPVVNIDDQHELEYAEFLLEKYSSD
ncbi:MAG: acylneuraminate cytidylyltransferase family protein [Syntrophobacterales bacterium]|jgi:CMP-N-acetylneuraminic acid synthetase